MRTTVILTILGFGLAIGGFLFGRATKPIPHHLVTAIIQAANADTKASMVSVQLYEGRYQYVLVRTMTEIPNTQFHSRLFRVSENGGVFQISQELPNPSIALRVDGDENLRLVDSFDSMLLMH